MRRPTDRVPGYPGLACPMSGQTWDPHILRPSSENSPFPTLLASYEISRSRGPPSSNFSRSKQALQIACAMHDSHDQNFKFTHLIEDEMLGIAGNQNAPDIDQFGMFKPGDCAGSRVFHT